MVKWVIICRKYDKLQQNTLNKGTKIVKIGSIELASNIMKYWKNIGNFHKSKSKQQRTSNKW
jgi:hypothetical protein